jgi:hypothetical protein
MFLTRHYSGEQIRKNRWAGHEAGSGDRRGIYRVLVGRPEGRRPLGMPTRRLEGNIKTELQKVGWRARSGLIWLRIGSGGAIL